MQACSPRRRSLISVIISFVFFWHLRKDGGDLELFEARAIFRNLLGESMRTLPLRFIVIIIYLALLLAVTICGDLELDDTASSKLL